MYPQIVRRFSSLLRNPLSSAHLRRLSSVSNDGDDDWNDSWETAWLPPDTKPTTAQDPWEDPPTLPSLSSADTETTAFVHDMTENWELRRTRNNNSNNNSINGEINEMKRGYRLRKQRIHASLWVKEIERRDEASLMPEDHSLRDGPDDIQRLLDSCSEIFDSPNADIDNSKIPSSSELKNKPDGWETTAKAQDGSVWEMSQREDDVLVQEFERRIAFCKFQIASFIKTHIFSRRRPIDGWKYMIEEIGPNARKGKGSVSRIPSLSDEATQPFREERTPIASNAGYIKGR